MSADVRLMTNVNPAHRLWLTGPPEMKELGADINALGEARRRAVDEVAAHVASTQSALTEERNRLAVLMAELTVPVIVANTEGRILLYNAAARGLVTEEAALGLGRSVFGVVERDVVLHALAQLGDKPRPVQVATAQPDGRLLRARIAGVRDAEGGLTGIVLVLEDLTSAAKATQRQDAFLRELSRATRSSVANIRAAIETVLEYPDMTAEDRAQFLSIVAEEAARLGEQTQSWFDGSLGTASEAWLPADMPAADLLIVLAGELARAGYDADILVAADAVAPESSWLKVDSHALSKSIVHLAGRVMADCNARQLELAYDERRGHAAVDLRWAGDPVSAAMFGRWLGDPAGREGSASLHDVVDLHSGEIWAAVGDDDVPYVRLMLPLTESGTGSTDVAELRESRPEFYDFDLFDLSSPDASADLRERRLEDLVFTVLDTETTGLDPDTDEIISIGAVRCVNGRLLQGETFERLVDPKRRVPDASTAIHGITNEMVKGQPTIDQVLPAFARFSEDTVLVGHNVGFDMRFLKLKEAATGVVFDQPVLDTLLLDAVLHPDHTEHSLEAIAERIGVDVLGRHTALGDALVTGEVFLGMVRLLAQHGIVTLGAAIEASRATYMSRVDRHYTD
jgi:DNA polymerase-3 subunit epsilon